MASTPPPDRRRPIDPTDRAPRRGQVAPHATPPVPPPRVAGGTFPRRFSAASSDGRRWEMLTNVAGVTVTSPRGTVAEARVSERGDQVVLEIWAGADLPQELSSQLVDHAFAHPSVRSDRPVLVCLPTRYASVLREVTHHVADPRTRVAGVTCLVEGRVGGARARS
jgi:hypothetical protein